MTKTVLTPSEELNIIIDYKDNKLGIYDICEKYRIGKLKVKAILSKYGIEIKKRGKQPLDENFVVNDWKIQKYPAIKFHHYIIYDEKTDFISKDINNEGGTLTTYIRNTYGIQTPTLYDRRLYYMRTGNYWWEQWLKVKIVHDNETKKCKLCEWETYDVNNRSGMLMQHLLKVHNLTPEKYMEMYPEEESYFVKQVKKMQREEKLKNEHNYIICPICNKKFEKLTESHMVRKHGISLFEFRKKYPYCEILSKNMEEQCTHDFKKGNLVVSKNRFISKYERELHAFLDGYNIEYNANRQILDGKEIDILIPEKKLGIEFDGLKFHTEFFGKKSHSYHLNKSKTCNSHGYSLIHIFEDEYVNHKSIVLEKIKYLLGLDNNLPKAMGRKCEIQEIYYNDASKFLNEYHIQGSSKATVYIGAYFNKTLVAVMSFKNGNIKTTGWELTRYATDYHFICPGVASKCFSYFITKYNPDSVHSYADRRWTTDAENNLYTRLGFELVKVGAPDYSYYNEKIERYKRFHKMLFTKQKLIKKYGFTEDMTEIEMVRELGYDRIWDCGKFKYEWVKNKGNDIPTGPSLI